MTFVGCPQLFRQSVLAQVVRLGTFALAFGLIACTASSPEVEPTVGTSSDTSAATPADTLTETKRIDVVTTFLPITLFTEAVARECASVTALIPANLGPHDFQATANAVTALANASVLVKNGLEMEEFLDKLVVSAANPDLTVIDSSRGVATIDSSSDDHHGHRDHGHGHGEVNPHIWLDPLRAVQQVETIRDGLVKADPSCAEGYTRNAEIYTDQLKELNAEISKKLKPYQGKTFIAFHDFAPYFAERYGLKADFLVDLPEMNPSPVDLQRVASEVRATQLKALLSEPQEGNRSFNALAKDLGVKVVEFNPLETGSAESARNPETYLSVMRSNVLNLLQAIGD